MSNDGGPAFPNFERRPLLSGQVPGIQGGMSLRDYFAAAVVMGMCAGPRNDWTHPNVAENLAANAYVVADAMLAERNKS